MAAKTKKQMSPETDWLLWFKPQSNTAHYVSETGEELKGKGFAIRDIIDSAPRVTGHLDTARLQNILVELNVHFRVARILPALLQCDKLEKMDILGEDVGRMIEMTKLQLQLAGVYFRNPPINVSLEFTKVEQDALAKVTNENQENISRLKLCFIDSPGNTLIALKETFSQLCASFRDTCDYRLLQKAEKLFTEDLKKNNMLPIATELCGLTATMMQALLENIKTTPLDAREVQNRINEMAEQAGIAKGTKELLWADYERTKLAYRTEHDKLAGSILKSETIIEQRIKELHDMRNKAQKNIQRQIEDDIGPHKTKLARIEAETAEIVAQTAVQNRQHFRTIQDILKTIIGNDAAMKELELAVLQRCVALKTEIMALQDRAEILRADLHTACEEEQATNLEMLDLVRDRQERDERRRLAEEAALRCEQAAIVIQKTWRGHVVRKKMKQKKKKKKGKKGKGNGKGKSAPPKKPKPRTGAAATNNKKKTKR